MGDPFVHLHVASGYSLQYGASAPQVLVERALEHEMDTLALTDRDGLYGAVKFATACRSAGLRPVLGVDLAYRPGPAPVTRRAPSPARGGGYRDAAPARGGHPRLTLLAHAGQDGRRGWAALCRAVSAVHLAGERGRPVAEPETLAPYLADGHLLVLLGPDSLVGRALTDRRPDAADRAIQPWLELLPRENLLLEVVSHRLGAGGGAASTGAWGPGSSVHAARLAGFAAQRGIGAVLTNAVRAADRLDAPTLDVLDAARRLVVLDRRHLDRGNAEGFLKSGKQMHEIADEVARLAGLDSPARLLAQTRVVADRCALDPVAHLGLGEVHLPELEVAAVPGPSGAVRGGDADGLLRSRCEAAIGRRYGGAPRQRIWKRLDDELELIRGLGYAPYFLTVGDIGDLIRDAGVRAAARGSGAGSLVNYLLGVSGVDPLRHDLLMERFLSPLRSSLPDIDIDVESARRPEIYRRILDRYGAERCVCVSMMDTYRVRHAVRDVGAALGMPPSEIDAIAKAFPHIRARDARLALRDLPELRAARLDDEQLQLLFTLVERLDGLPRHIAVHPCGVLLSDLTLLDRTPVEPSYAGYPMSQFDKDDVEELGLLKLDVLGIRMQSAMAHAVGEIERTTGGIVDLDDPGQVPLDDDATFEMISTARTLGVFQIESPGQRELVGKSGIESFGDLITDISLFRPGPVKSDMVTPYLDAKQGWTQPVWPHEVLRQILGETHGVVVFHEQVIELIAAFAGVDRAEADQVRRRLGDHGELARIRSWFGPRARRRGFPGEVADRIWQVIEAFASFGFCKAHAAAFALPTYQSAWLKTHWPAHFLAGVLTHDPGMYPKRLILDDARQCGIAVLGLDVNASLAHYSVEAAEPTGPTGPTGPRSPVGDVPRAWWRPGTVPDRFGIRIALSEVKGISSAEVDRIVAARPFASVTDLWQRTRVSRAVLERLVLAGGLDAVYRIGRGGRITRRDLLLQLAELDRFSRAVDSAAARARPARGLRAARSARSTPVAEQRVTQAAARNSSDPVTRSAAPATERHALADGGIWARTSAQAQAPPPPAAVRSVQLTLDLGDEPSEGRLSGLPELGPAERLSAELEILGLDASGHVITPYADFLDALGAVRSRDLIRQRSRSELLVAGVKVATQTPPIRSGKRVVFLTLDDATGPVDVTFFEDAQAGFASTIFDSWLLVATGVLRRTGHRGVSLRGTGAWELPRLAALWRRAGIDAVRAELTAPPAPDPSGPAATEPGRVLRHSSGFRLSPYADVRPAGGSVRQGGGLSRSLWHRSPGSPG